MEFRNTDGRFGLEIGDRELLEMKKLCADAGSQETGGILVGRYVDARATAKVIRITSAPSDSRAGPTWFHRGTLGLQTLLDALWREGSYYLGEWHFHPRGAPIPSDRDSDELRSIATKDAYRCPEPILLIATIAEAGLQVGVYVYTREEGPIKLTSTGP